MSQPEGYAATQIGEKIPDRGVHPHTYLGGPRHSPRFTPPQRRRAIDMCIKVDGPYCRATVCYRDKRYEDLSSRPPGAQYKIFTVDHLDPEKGNWFDNIQIAHLECNNADRRPRLLSGQSSLRNATEREKNAHAELHIQTSVEAIAKVEGLPSVIALNYDHEIAFRRHMFKMALEASSKKKVLVKKEMRPASAEVSGSGRASSYFYTEKMFSDDGPLKEETDEFDKSKFVSFREPKDRLLNVDELMEKYPKTGR